VIDDFCEIHVEGVLFSSTLYSVIVEGILASWEKTHLLWKAYMELPLRKALYKEYVDVCLIVSSL
jgi:hypothetical protein